MDNVIRIRTGEEGDNAVWIFSLNYYGSPIS
jgi:hypothetical protein